MVDGGDCGGFNDHGRRDRRNRFGGLGDISLNDRFIRCKTRYCCSGKLLEYVVFTFPAAKSTLRLNLVVESISSSVEKSIPALLSFSHSRSSLAEKVWRALSLKELYDSSCSRYQPLAVICFQEPISMTRGVPNLSWVPSESPSQMIDSLVICSNASMSKCRRKLPPGLSYSNTNESPTIGCF